MKRLFTFGCSYTSWSWPTWADMLVYEYKQRGLEGYNFGRCGAGNQYIFIKLLEADRKYKFTEEDTVIVEWTSMQREDRFAVGRWHTPGSIYSQNIYTSEFMDKWADPVHYVFRDCALISSVKKMLTLSKVNYVDFTMSTFKYLDSSNYNLQFEDVNEVLEFYGESIETTLPSMLEYLDLHKRSEEDKNRRPLSYWPGNKETLGREWHPTPVEHFKYLSEVLLPHLQETLSESTLGFVEHWDKSITKLKQPINLEETGWAMNYSHSNPL